MSDYLKIAIPFPVWNEQYNIVSTTENGNSCLNRLADNLGLEVMSATREEFDCARVTISAKGFNHSSDCYFLNDFSAFPGQILGFSDKCKFATEIDAEVDFTWARSLLWGRTALALLMASLILSGKKLCPLHGSSFAMADKDEAVLLFGQSGIGKSTAMKRAISQGGRKISDDMLLLTANDEGKVFVQPMPTWSGLREDTYDPYYKVDMNEIYEVTAAFALHRGEDDEIVLADKIWWRQFLIQALHVHLYIPINSVHDERKGVITTSMLDFSTMLGDKFPPYEILSDVNGKLYEKVKAHLAK